MKRAKMNSRLFWLGISLAALVGCGEGSSGTNEPTVPDEEVIDDPSVADDSDPTDSDNSDPVGSDPSEPSNPDPSDPDPTDPSEPDLEGTFCLPQPIREDGLTLVNLWELSKPARNEGCYLESVLENVEGDDDWTAGETLAPAETDWTCDAENRCRQYKGQFVIAWELEPDEFGWNPHPDLSLGTAKIWEVELDGETQWDIEVMSVRNGSTATFKLERTYQATGKILVERSYVQTTLHQEVTSTYEQGHLVSQETLEHHGNGNSSIRTRTWSYDQDGKMVESSYQRVQTMLYTAAFEYDEQGRVSSLERAMDGVRYLTQSWAFEDDKLVSRTSVFEGDIYFQGADNFLPNIRDGFSSHWEDAGKRKGFGGCEQVPTSVIHGYPESDDVYVLGWKRNDVPTGIGFAYGYDGFGFSYGDYSWMGHLGIATSYASSQMMTPSRIEMNLTYNTKGQMIEETVETEAVWGEETASGLVTRIRQFDDDLLTEDLVTAENIAGEMFDFESHGLTFAYDATGKLVERSAERAGVTVSQSTWTYDDLDRINEHAIYGVFWNSDESATGDLPLTGAFRDRYVQDGQSEDRYREQKNIAGDDWFIRSSTRVTQSEAGQIDEGDYYYHIRNLDGVLTEVGTGTVTEHSSFLSVKRDAMNFLEESGRLSTGNLGTLLRRYTHQCSNQ